MKVSESESGETCLHQVSCRCLSLLFLGWSKIVGLDLL